MEAVALPPWRPAYWSIATTMRSDKNAIQPSPRAVVDTTYNGNDVPKACMTAACRTGHRRLASTRPPTSDPVLTALENLDDFRNKAVLFDVDDIVIGNAAGNNGCNKSAGKAGHENVGKPELGTLCWATHSSKRCRRMRCIPR